VIAVDSGQRRVIGENLAGPAPQKELAREHFLGEGWSALYSAKYFGRSQPGAAEANPP